jgi:hypothetical protein
VMDNLGAFDDGCEGVQRVQNYITRLRSELGQ